MKPAPFDYARPATLAEAIALLASAPSAMPLAGGQSLMPVLAFRMATPSLLVDLGAVPGLDRIDIGPDRIRLGARVRWCDIERNAALAQAHPLLAAAVANVAHYAIRNRGTIGGSLAHADPAAELPGVSVACDGLIHLEGPSGRRTVDAASFFLGPLTTARGPAELIVALELPAWPAARRWAFEEFARRRGDFALCGVAAFFDLDPAGRVRDPHIGVIGACRRPHRITDAEAVLAGRVPDDGVIAAAAEAAARSVDPPADLHGPAEYRRALCATLTSRALRRATGLPAHP